MAVYETMYTGGDSIDDQWMTVYLYPFNDKSSIENACMKGGVVADAVQGAADHLLGHGAIDYYEILRFRAEDSDKNYPGIPDSDSNHEDWGDIDDSSIASDFRDYLRGHNDKFDDSSGEDNFTHGLSYDLIDEIGSHHLVHDGDKACNETGGYAPKGAGSLDEGFTAFTEGLMAWSPVCSDEGLTRNAAIQETLHLFCDDDYDDQWTGSIDSKEDQHTLGRVGNISGLAHPVTPMLTYHWDDNITDRGVCESYDPDPIADTYEQEPTACTKDAIEKTADQHIPENL